MTLFPDETSPTYSTCLIRLGFDLKITKITLSLKTMHPAFLSLGFSPFARCRYEGK